MKMTSSAILLIGVITLVSCANPPAQTGNFGCSGTDSPDHQLRACIIEVGKFPPPFNESRVDIRDTSAKLVRSRSFGSPKGDISMPALAASYAGEPAKLGDVPELGQHTAEVRREFAE